MTSKVSNFDSFCRGHLFYIWFVAMLLLGDHEHEIADVGKAMDLFCYKKGFHFGDPKKADIR